MWIYFVSRVFYMFSVWHYGRHLSYFNAQIDPQPTSNQAAVRFYDSFPHL